MILKTQRNFKLYNRYIFLRQNVETIIEKYEINVF